MAIAFGLSTSLITLLASRFFGRFFYVFQNSTHNNYSTLGGLVAGNVAVLHSILVEITDDSNQNIAIPIYSLSAASGAVVGCVLLYPALLDV